MSNSKHTPVETKEDFLRVVSQLAARKDLSSWENSSAPDFVEALGRWLEDADGYYQNMGLVMDTTKPSWQLFADMLQAAQVYE